MSDDSDFENELNQNKTTNSTEKPKICNQTVVFGILLTGQVCTNCTTLQKKEVYA